MAFTVSIVGLSANNAHSALSSSLNCLTSILEVVPDLFDWQNRPVRWWTQRGKGWTLISLPVQAGKEMWLVCCTGLCAQCVALKYSTAWELTEP